VIGSTFGFDRPEDGFSSGWYNMDGKFKRFKPSGTVFRDRDRTIAALLARLHVTMGLDKFNRFFSYPDETRDDKLLPYRYHGINWAWSRVSSSKGRPFNSPRLHAA
jgi:hypothetical protein